MANSVKLGDFSLKPVAQEKPIGLTPDGGFVYPKDVFERKTLGLANLNTQPDELRIKLTTERLKAEDDFTIGIIDGGSYSKREVLNEVEQHTELGEYVIRAELNYCEEFSQQLRSRQKITTVIPKLPAAVNPVIDTDWKWIPKPQLKLFAAKALFCENTTDNVTKLAVGYRKAHVHKAFADRGFIVEVLEGLDDVRHHFAQKAKQARVVFIGGVGHGSPTVYTGHLNDPLLRVGMYDPAEVKSNFIHLLSCQTAKQLGPDMVSKGAVAYAGYFENFTFVYDNPNTIVNELNLFWQCDSAISICLANGHPMQTAHATAIATYNAAIAQVPNTNAATWLTHDRNYLRTPASGAAYGNATARVPRYVFASVLAPHVVPA